MTNGKTDKRRKENFALVQKNWDEIDWGKNTLRNIEGLITDGYQYWTKKCCMCGQDSMEIVRVGKVQCGNCD
jgi:hypothetical protein